MLNEQDFFDVLSDDIRRRILALLLGQGELCVCEIQVALDMAQHKISRHLAVMREAELLSMQREGTWVYYRVHPQLPLWTFRIMENFAQGVAHSRAYQADKRRLESMSNRPAHCVT